MIRTLGIKIDITRHIIGWIFYDFIVEQLRCSEMFGGHNWISFHDMIRRWHTEDIVNKNEREYWIYMKERSL